MIKLNDDNNKMIRLIDSIVPGAKIGIATRNDEEDGEDEKYLPGRQPMQVKLIQWWKKNNACLDKF